MQDAVLSVISTINVYMFDYVLTFLLVSVGIWYSFQTKFVQVHCFVKGIRTILKDMSFNGSRQKVGITPFRALVNGIGSQVGTGNIVGASSAILIGGPGAIFWMWIIAFFGMATSYAETVCALGTRKIDLNGIIRGGPVYYILTAFKSRFGKFLAAFFAVSTIMSAGLSIFMLQSNSIASNLNGTFGIPNWATGIILVIICGFILQGGIERISSVTEKIVPIMSYLFIGGGFGETLKLAVSQGVKRGLFSNEAGMGSTPHAHAQANIDNPHLQGIIAMHGVFFDTFIILTLNALVIISRFTLPTVFWQMDTKAMLLQ